MDTNRKQNSPPLKIIDSQSIAAKQTAFHQAGHATAIYLYNKLHNLPPIFFQISTHQICGNKIGPNNIGTVLTTKTEGGMLIQNIPVSGLENKKHLTSPSGKALTIAYEADIVNLLAGPIAEAKYIALRDDEIFNPFLINVNALKFYSGRSDLDRVNEYLENFIDAPQKREQKLATLFNKAFYFIDNQYNWKAIASLANCILNNNNRIVTCEEAFSILDNSFNLLSKVLGKPNNE